jgi:hypothetical protein
VYKRILDATILLALFVAITLGAAHGFRLYETVQAEALERNVITQYLNNMIASQKDQIDNYCDARLEAAKDIETEK